MTRVVAVSFCTEYVNWFEFIFDCNCTRCYYCFFLPRDAMLARSTLSSVRLSVHPSVSPSQAGIVSKQLDGWDGIFLSPIINCV